ncbi:hypothetical protein LINGRAHAP2_LOCUS33031 [Linum grandiflorum]
MLLPWDGRRA